MHGEQFITQEQVECSLQLSFFPCLITVMIPILGSFSLTLLSIHMPPSLFSNWK